MLAIATVGMFASIALASGLLLAFTPYLMPGNECFAVTVPASAKRDPDLAALKKRYASAMVAWTVASTAAAIAAGALIVRGSEGPKAGVPGAGIALELVAVLMPVAASFALMLSNRRKVMDIKRKRGWAASRSQAAALVAEEDVPKAIPLAWSLLYIPVILGTVALALALYPQMPDMIPMHSDLAGNVDRWAPKTLGSVIGFPTVFQLFMAACFSFCHWAILRSKRPANPDSPVTSALAYGLFARAQSIFLLATGVFLSGGIGVLFLLSSTGFIDLVQAALAVIVFCIPLVIGSIALSLAYGQAGSRVFRRMQEGGAGLLADDDSHWKLGVFYVNPDDASVFLPERFGFGWTMNFARPAAWAITLGGIALTVGFIVAISSLV